MFPGMGGMDPKAMNSMLKNMGVRTTEINAEKVVIFSKDGGQITITAPQVTQIDFRGQKSFQISGDVAEQGGSEGSGEDDVKIVMLQTGATVQAAQAALKETDGDLAQAIMKLKK